MNLGGVVKLREDIVMLKKSWMLFSRWRLPIGSRYSKSNISLSGMQIQTFSTQKPRRLTKKMSWIAFGEKGGHGALILGM